MTSHSCDTRVNQSASTTLVPKATKFLLFEPLLFQCLTLQLIAELIFWNVKSKQPRSMFVRLSWLTIRFDIVLASYVSDSKHLLCVALKGFGDETRMYFFTMTKFSRSKIKNSPKKVDGMTHQGLIQCRRKFHSSATSASKAEQMN